MNYERIDELLAEKGMSRRQLAIEAGISIDTMSSWFRRRTKRVPADCVKRIADVLNVHYWTLLVIDDTMNISDIIQNMISTTDELKTGYSDTQLIADFHKLTIPNQRLIIRQMKEYFEQQQEELKETFGYKSSHKQDIQEHQDRNVMMAQHE